MRYGLTLVRRRIRLTGDVRRRDLKSRSERLQQRATIDLTFTRSKRDKYDSEIPASSATTRSDLSRQYRISRSR
jgi:hypothetical protein